MTQKVAILGLGASGGRWARIFHKAGWKVAVFDPDSKAEGSRPLKGDWKRHDTISSTVHGVDWVMICLPERLELMRTVIQRAQSGAPENAIIASASRAFDIDDVQTCAMRPACVIQIRDGDEGGFSLNLSPKNDAKVREEVSTALAELAAVASLDVAPQSNSEQSSDAASA
jgi:3-hydroxyacyl-CoA dehydrogenase